MAIWQDIRTRSSDTGIGYLPKSHARKGEDENSNWIYSFSDMVTLLLAFFIIIAAVSEPSNEKYTKVQQSIAQTLHIKAGEVVNTTVKLPRNIVIVKEPVPHEAKPVPATENAAADNATQPNQDATRSPEASYPELPQELAKMSAVVTALKHVIEDEGLAKQISITSMGSAATISFPEGVFFESGDAAFSKEAKPFLNKIAISLKDLPTEYIIQVEGHTDNRRIFGKRKLYPTNWELSSARATQVVRYMINRGIEPHKLSAIGYADTRPIAANLDKRGNPIEENQKRNRRVVLKIITRDDGGQK